MKPEEVTQQILGAWDEIVAEDTVTEEESPEEPDEQPDEEESEEEEQEEEAPSEDEDETGEEEEAEEGSEEEGEEEPESAPSFDTEDLEIRAFLAKFQGDPEQALRYGLQSQQALSKLGNDRAALQRRVEELEGELQNTRAFATNPTMLTQEQREWVEEAVESGTPSAYVQEAMKAGEFDLARAVAAEWGREQPYEALRATQFVDQLEAETYAAQNQPPTYEPFNPQTANVVLDEVTKYFPDIERYAGEMAQVMAKLGDEHQLVVDARSGDPDRTVGALVQILDIARVSSHSIAETRQKARNGNREEQDGVRRRAVVASADSAPTPSETPRSVRIGPGLTLEQLDAEWARNT